MVMSKNTNSIHVGHRAFPKSNKYTKYPRNNAFNDFLPIYSTYSIERKVRLNRTNISYLKKRLEKMAFVKRKKQ